ncbi:uncharacterized protein LY89DRAFT_715304 [Mollisia scopiformis]|uniref:LIM zinc-binding domain-containing protein n=1 Tax=Mollisia scopiformis TaxID=149040 RepID=A0A194XML3_MOLSC|nr:uncharacterized protein LY89DRAFT_715304 [Mollisia scopiformis]KUJ21012.1 hypothetical protein LY89DRAFT_715304 [Mollisia scopiformis]
MDHIHSSSRRRSSHRTVKDEDRGEATFVCTVCWRSQYAPSKPKLLGSSARIVCKPCWKAVLDLSICWVCGEYIVRGDEVVSLGWCFWHRACFGCLVCGTRMSVPCHKEGVDGRYRGEVGMGVELVDIPLCGVCGVEMSGESPGLVLEKGLENVSRFDGGLSRERLQRWSEVSNEDEEEAIGDKSRSVGLSQSRRQLHHGDSPTPSRKRCPKCTQRPTSNTRNIHSLLHSAMNTRISGDGSVDESRVGDPYVESHKQPRPDEESSPVYVSVLDPIGGRAFEPSKTKPLPKWMHLLPNNIHRGREQEEKDRETYAFDNMSKGYQTASVSYAQAENGHHESENSSRNVTPKTAETQTDVRAPPMYIPNAHQHTRSRSKITFEPHSEAKPLEANQRDTRRSHTIESAYMTPPEYPRQKTPLPRLPRPSIDHQDTSYFSHRPSESSIKDSWEREDICCGLGSPQREPTPTPEQMSPPQLWSPPLSRRPNLAPSQSSEYLERYRPKSAATKHERYVAKDPEPILDKLKRQRVGNQNLEQQVAEERIKKRRASERTKSPKLADEEYGLDPRRKDLNQELRSLFCEE